MTAGVAGFPVVRIAEPRTVRLVSSARLREPVLAKLAPADMLDDLAEIEGATSARLVGQSRGGPGLPRNEYVFNVPHARFINASFAYARPGALNRFNGPDRGAWYAALLTETCVAEVSFHMTRELGNVGDYRATVDYVEMFASFAGAFVDLRSVSPPPQCLHPEPAAAYPAGNALADATRAQGVNGIIYPSVRHAGGTCFAALWPHAVQSVAQGELYRMQWSGSPTPTVTRI